MKVTHRRVAADRDEDRVGSWIDADAHGFVVADGAGGMADGARAAERVIELAHDARGPTDLTSLLRRIDAAIASDKRAGETTGIVVVVRGALVSGASVGDSAAWMVAPREVIDLTEHQNRKPLLGSGKATPRAFGPVPLRGRLLVASDGLFKYARRDAIVAAASLPDIEAAADALVAAARLPSGALQDDIAIVLAG
jgi:PPM family protein phosphatase